MQDQPTIHRYGMRARPWGMGTFPKNENVIGPCPKNNRKDSGYYDILLSSEPLSEKEIYDFELTDLNENTKDNGMEQTEERREELENDIKRLLMIFERETNAQICHCVVGRRQGDDFEIDTEIALEGE